MSALQGYAHWHSDGGTFCANALASRTATVSKWRGSFALDADSDRPNVRLRGDHGQTLSRQVRSGVPKRLP